MQVTMFVDGSSKGNPGPGGCCSILLWGNYNKVIRDSHPDTTNNRMELMAILLGLEAIKRPCEITVYTDSINAIGWLYGWDTKEKEPNGDKKFKIKDPNIQVLVDAINEVVEENGHVVTMKHVKGHDGNRMNELADQYAQEAAEMQLKEMS